MDTLVVFLLMIFPNLVTAHIPKSAYGKECARFMCEYQISEQITNIRNENSELVERIAKLEQHQKAVVSAYVRLSETTTVNTSHRVKYDTEVSNVGSAYNFEKGQFTAPVPGIYLIHVSACLFPPAFMNLDIMKNGVKVGAVRAGDKSYVECTSGAASLHLEAGDDIWVERADPSSGTGLFEGRGWNTFAATLVHADIIN